MKLDRRFLVNFRRFYLMQRQKITRRSFWLMNIKKRNHTRVLEPYLKKSIARHKCSVKLHSPSIQMNLNVIWKWIFKNVDSSIDNIEISEISILQVFSDAIVRQGQNEHIVEPKRAHNYQGHRLIQAFPSNAKKQRNFF